MSLLFLFLYPTNTIVVPSAHSPPQNLLTFLSYLLYWPWNSQTTRLIIFSSPSQRKGKRCKNVSPPVFNQLLKGRQKATTLQRFSCIDFFFSKRPKHNGLIGDTKYFFPFRVLPTHASRSVQIFSSLKRYSIRSKQANKQAFGPRSTAEGFFLSGCT